MADSTISNLTAKTAPGTGDLLLLVDVSDTTMAATGTDKKTTVSQLMGQAPVQSVAGKTGAVTLANTDISGLGTASTKAASGTGATVASVTGTFTVGHLATFSDTSGTIQDGGAIPSGGSMAIGGTITSATQGSVLFAGVSGVLAQDNANLFWDDTNHRLGIGTATPSVALEVAGGLIKAGTHSATQPVVLDMSNNASIGYAQFKYPNNGLFVACETGVLGTNDVFFQAFPGTTAGYGYLEAYNASGMCIGTGTDTPVLIRPNRTTTATFHMSGTTLEVVSSSAADLTQRLKGASAQTGDFLNCVTYTNLVVAKIDKNGAITCGTSTTASRPTISSVGTMWYDTTLGKPIWWNGTAWTDAAGTVV